MGMPPLLSNFVTAEDGAVTIDWVVLTGAMVGLGVAASLTLVPGVQDLSGDISSEMKTNGVLMQTDFSASRITNGGFEDSNGNSHAAGWGGVDIEILAAGVYIPGAGASLVAELDGWNAGDVSSLTQDFTVDGPLSTVVSLDSALRTAVATPNESEGFLLEVVDKSGTALAQKPVIPNSRDFETYRMPVRFAEAGTYTLRMTEIGRNDTLGAVVDNVAIK